MKKIPTILAAVALCAIAPELEAQFNIDHAGLECIAPGRYAVVLSGIDPGVEIQFAKVYFRSSLFPDFYFVDMKLQGDRYVGVLPQVAPETPAVVYYIEAIDESFNVARSAEFEPAVEDPCDDAPPASFVPGSDPGIVVGATAEGQSALPPGFSAAGIIGTITAAGAVAGVGAGLSTGAVVVAAAGAAGVAGGVVATQSSDEETTTTTTEPPPRTTSVAPITTVNTTSTIPPQTTTTAPASSTTTAPVTEPLNPGCFTIADLGNCTARFDATCVNQPVDRYEWLLDQGNKWGQAHIPDGAAAFDYHWDACDDNDARLVFRLTVHRGGSSMSRVQSFQLSGRSELRSQDPQPLALRSHLALPPFDGTAQGRLSFDGTTSRIVDSSQPSEIRVAGASGLRRVEGVVIRAGAGAGEWRFDFGQESRLVAGSLRAVQGNVLAVEPRAIVFHIAGQAQERVSFTFELTR